MLTVPTPPDATLAVTNFASHLNLSHIFYNLYNLDGAVQCRLTGPTFRPDYLVEMQHNTVLADASVGDK